MPLSFKNSETPAPVMQGTPVPPEWRVPAGGYDTPPFNRWSFQNMRQIAHTADIRRGDTVWDMPGDAQDMSALEFQGSSGPTTWARMLDDTYTDATLVWLNGRVVVEEYFNAMAPRSQHIVFSVSKSLTSAVAGCLIGDGLVDPTAPVTEYVPDLARCAWNGASAQQVLDMTTGVVFDETYDDPQAEVWRLDVAANLRPAPPEMTDPPETIRDLILWLSKTDAAHGARFSYRSIETEVLSTILEAASGQNFVPMMSERLWAPMGAEEDAYVAVDRASFAMSDGGICTTLRDLARFGRLLLEDGCRDGQRIIPKAWIDDIRGGDHGLFDDEHRDMFPNGRYRNMFWIPDRERPAHMCLGIHGQHVWVDPERGLVAVKLSSWPTALSDESFLGDWMAGVDAIVAAHG
ncbi:serine hydrolase domain-containing protein [Aestuariivita boseongensis]|uniref:serine hydrolase domain-containing protein n=1 Tax=Aestuariivita boseongensis TaxID=1470562 RepID=UPI0009E1C0F7|nr:serine hydrolase [Aestuariivita boseongensis]